MDPNSALQDIDEAKRVDAETRETMVKLYGWLSHGGFAPDWENYPKGTRRFRKAYGQQRGMVSPTRSHATRRSSAHASMLEIGDIVQRSDVDGHNRYVIVNIQDPWIYTRRISGSGGPGVITFPTELMLRKVG